MTATQTEQAPSVSEIDVLLIATDPAVKAALYRIYDARRALDRDESTLDKLMTAEKSLIAAVLAAAAH